MSRAPSGIVGTAVGMHDGALDKVEGGSGRIMELRDGGISLRHRRGSGDQVFSINSGGWLGRAGESGSPCLVVRHEHPSCRRGEANIAQGSSGD